MSLYNIEIGAVAAFNLKHAYELFHNPYLKGVKVYCIDTDKMKVELVADYDDAVNFYGEISE